MQVIRRLKNVLWILTGLLLALEGPLRAEVSVVTIDLLEKAGYEVNAIGPILVKADPTRNRVIVANTLSSSITIIDGATDEVTNIPVGRRGLQHLKSEAMMIHRASGRVYLIGDHSLILVDPDSGTSQTYETEAQFESVVVDETSGNAFFCGRESSRLGFYNARTRKLSTLHWLEYVEELVNLNQTPPPPLRRVVALPSKSPDGERRIAAIDGFEAMLYLFDAKSGSLLTSQSLPLQHGGRWHLAGVNAKSSHIYLVTETLKRKAIQAAKINVDGEEDVVVELPGFTEPAGITYNIRLDQVYIPYDNHATVHVVDFAAGGELLDMAVPSFGNDASAIDHNGNVLYLGSWAQGEIEIIDLEKQRFVRRIQGLGIIPHMFTMAFNAANGDLYFPVGATAVNGCFGAAVTRFDPNTNSSRKIHIGWAPIDLIEVPEQQSFLVFGNEDRFAKVGYDGQVQFHQLPYTYPLKATHGPDGQVYLTYGTHQSYWPVVYIWAARNGVLSIDPSDLSFYDRRIPRQPLDLATDENGVLYLPQNNWGTENQFLVVMEDGVRELDINKRIEFEEEVTRETTQRILRYDEKTHLLYLVRVGEKNDDLSVLQVIDPESQKIVQRLELGHYVTDLVIDEQNLYTANFGSGSVSVINKNNWSVQEISAGRAPSKLCQVGNRVFVLDHLGNSIYEIGGSGQIWHLSLEGFADNVITWNNLLVVVGYSPNKLTILFVNPETGEFLIVHEHNYPYGDMRLNTYNSSFFMTGQFGDAIYRLTKVRIAENGDLWLADFLSGKVFVLSP